MRCVREVIMNFRIGSAKISDIKVVEDNNKKKRPSGNYTVKAGDTVYGLTHAFNFKNEKEFRDYVKMSGTAKLQKGTVLNLPTVKIETTFAAIARKYNMSIKDLAKLNPQIKDVNKISKGTLINVPYRAFEKQDDTVTFAASETEIPETPAVIPPSDDIIEADSSTDGNDISTSVDNDVESEVRAGVPVYTPEDIAKELKKSASDFGAITRKNFKTAFAKVNKDNVFEVIKAYDKISPKESLIEMICSEVANKFNRGNPRKDAVMQLYNLIEKRAGSGLADENVRKAFKEELDAQFDKWFTLVSTKKLDKIVNSLIDGKYPDGIERAGVPGNTEVVINGNKSGFTVDSLYEDWQKNAKLWNREEVRPRPSVDKDGNPVADVRVYEPAGKGVLSGKTIIVNPGHGGIMADTQNNSVNFDPGASNAVVVKRKQGKKTIEIEHKSQFIGNGGKALEEWTVNRQFGDALTEKLTKQGAKVVYITGSAYVVPKTIEKYRKDADMVISLHANSVGDKEGIMIIPTTSRVGKSLIPDDDDADLAETIQKNLEQDDRFKGYSKIKTQGLAVLRGTDGRAYEGPDILIETGNLKNPKDVERLTDEKYVNSLAEKLNKSIVDYLSAPKKKKLTIEDIRKTFNLKYVDVEENPFHTVKSGENLSLIAKKYGVQVRGIKELNRMKSDSLDVGQVLKIPPRIEAKNIDDLKDVSKAVGLSLEYIRDLKKSEDAPGFGENDFHKKAYHDKNGNLTIGIGHLIKPDEISRYKNDELTKEEVCTLLAQDILDRAENLKIILGAETYNNLPAALKDAVMDFTFSRGEGTIQNHPGFVEALQDGDYEKAISLMNIDYSVKNGKKVYLAGMAKRRLFEIYHACKIYDGDIPKEILKSAQKLYERGLKHMETEFPNPKVRANIKAGYNEEIRGWFGDDIILK